MGGVLVAAMLLTGFPKLSFANEQPPNIIFILTDDHRWDTLSCLDHPFVQTPNMDRLVKEGVIFNNDF